MRFAIRMDVTASDLRVWARRCRPRRELSRAYAIAHAQDSLWLVEAARVAVMERQALSEAVVRYNAEELAGLFDRPRQRRGKLTDGQVASLRGLILHGPNSGRDSVSIITRPNTADLI